MVIEICNITKKYDDFTCLEQVSLTIPDGTVYGLVGENGAGKSTLIRLIAGVYKADSGEIRIDGKKLPDIKAKQEIFYMPDTQYYSYFFVILQISIIALFLFFSKSFSGPSKGITIA